MTTNRYMPLFPCRPFPLMLRLSKYERSQVASHREQTS